MSRHSAADLFITRVVRTAWASAEPPGNPHERSIRVRRCPATCTAIVTQLDTQADRCPGRSVNAANRRGWRGCDQRSGRVWC